MNPRPRTAESTPPDWRLLAYKEALFQQFGRLGRAVSHPGRLEILDLLNQAERTVEDLVRQTGRSHSNLSQHLAVLKGARLVTRRKAGLFVYYKLADPVVGEFWQMFRQVAMRCMPGARAVYSSYAHDLEQPPEEATSAARHAQGDAHGDRSGANGRAPDAPGVQWGAAGDVRDAGSMGLQETQLDQLLARVECGEIVLLDVRPAVEFRAGHIPGALSIPLTELELRWRELPAQRRVLAYCRGAYCLMAREAVRLLAQHGIAAEALDVGVPEWRASGRPVEAEREG